MYGPAARAMKRGVPPTARNARTGEFTPPGMTFWARSKSCSLVLFGCSVDMAGVLRWRVVVGGRIAGAGLGTFLVVVTGWEGPEESIRDHVAHAGAKARVQRLVEKGQRVAGADERDLEALELLAGDRALRRGEHVVQELIGQRHAGDQHVARAVLA